MVPGAAKSHKGREAKLRKLAAEVDVVVTVGGGNSFLLIEFDAAPAEKLADAGGAGMARVKFRTGGGKIGVGRFAEVLGNNEAFLGFPYYATLKAPAAREHGKKAAKIRRRVRKVLGGELIRRGIFILRFQDFAHALKAKIAVFIFH